MEMTSSGLAQPTQLTSSLCFASLMLDVLNLILPRVMCHASRGLVTVTTVPYDSKCCVSILRPPTL